MACLGRGPDPGPRQRGTIRKLTIPGAGTVTERLENQDEISHTSSYAITDRPLPVADYHATIRVRQDGDEALVEWESRFEPKGASADDAAKTIQGIFQAGFDNLQTLFGGGTGGPSGQ